MSEDNKFESLVERLNVFCNQFSMKSRVLSSGLMKRKVILRRGCF